MEKKRNILRSKYQVVYQPKKSKIKNLHDREIAIKYIYTYICQ